MMKLLLDESIPANLLSEFPNRFEVCTVTQMGWAGVSNGRLITLAAENNFAALITADQGVAYQQNTQNLQIAIVILAAYRTHISYLAPLIPEVVELLEANPEYGVYNVSK